MTLMTPCGQKPCRVLGRCHTTLTLGRTRIDPQQHPHSAYRHTTRLLSLAGQTQNLRSVEISASADWLLDRLPAVGLSHDEGWLR